MRLFLLVLVFLSSGNWIPAWPQSAIREKLKNQIDSLFYLEDFKYSILSSTAMNVSTGTILYSHNPDKILVPASTLKLISTFIALDELGGDHRFTTQLGYTGQILDDGTLTGDLVVLGSGDPTLGSTKFAGNRSFEQLLDRWVHMISDLNIQCIDGNIIVDGSQFDALNAAPTWQYNDLGNYYASGSWGINIRDNEYDIHFAPGRTTGSKTRLSGWNPEVPGLKLANDVMTGKPGSGDQAYVFGAPFQYNRRIIGTIPPGSRTFTIRGSIPDPPFFLAYHLFKKLYGAGISVYTFHANIDPGQRPKNIIVISSEYSVTVGEMVQYANTESDNLITDALVKALAVRKNGIGSFEGGIRCIYGYLEDQGLETEGLQIKDGCGLSARNRVSSRLMVRFLTFLWNEKFGQQILNYIPKAGSEGTVRNLLTVSNEPIKAWIKSGSMEGVLGYAGFLQNSRGEWVSFSLIINGLSDNQGNIKKHIDQYLYCLYKYS